MPAENARTDPDRHDPERWGHSLANLREILVGCLDARGARSVAEVGAYAGDLTTLLLDWAAGAGARILAIEPNPHPSLEALADERHDLELVRQTSHDALREIELPDAVIVDGDHNYFTVTEELRIIGERAPGAAIPLLMFHDVGWPHGRRDAYWDYERIPAEHRQALETHPRILPGHPGLVDDGLLLYASAVHEGGPRNGVLTAIEDFLDDRPELRLAIVPAFFGFGVAWHPDAPWADSLATVVEPWDRNQLIGRLEQNRVHHLAISQSREEKLKRAGAELVRLRHEDAQPPPAPAGAPDVDRLRAQSRSQERVLRALLDSRGIRIADRISALRHPGRDWSWAGRIRAALDPRGTRRDAVVRWESEERCVVGKRRFQILPDGFLDEPRAVSMVGADFLLLKERALIDRYATLLPPLRPRNVVELGILEGGSAAFLRELLRPNRLVALDQKPPTSPALRDYIADDGLADMLRVFGDVDQGDRPRLAQIVDDAFGSEPLDLVVDDCSHLYEPTRASFNELFPRLRPGGLYVIEDWRWAHTPLAEMWPDEVPLTRLVFELLIAISVLPGLIADVTINDHAVEVQRGDAPVVPREFEVSEHIDPRGRSLLAGS